jgi:hypothetical protein
LEAVEKGGEAGGIEHEVFGGFGPGDGGAFEEESVAVAIGFAEEGRHAVDAAAFHGVPAGGFAGAWLLVLHVKGVARKIEVDAEIGVAIQQRDPRIGVGGTEDEEIGPAGVLDAKVPGEADKDLDVFGLRAAGNLKSEFRVDNASVTAVAKGSDARALAGSSGPAVPRIAVEIFFDGDGGFECVLGEDVSGVREDDNRAAAGVEEFTPKA